MALDPGCGQPDRLRRSGRGWAWDLRNPNFLFSQFGMLERCALRNDNVHSADGWRDVLDPVIARYATRDILRLFRADAA